MRVARERAEQVEGQRLGGQQVGLQAVDVVGRARLARVDVGADREAAVFAPECLEEAGGGLEAVVGGDEGAVSAAGCLGDERHAVDRTEAAGITITLSGTYERQ
nr:hypothetical protein [Methylobacterium frigidaeris]